MKIAICADLHLGAGDLHQASEQLSEMLEKSAHCGLLCIAGDIFDSPSIGDARTTGAIARVAIEAVSAYPRAILLVGNHDSAGAGSEDALHVFDGMPSVRVVRQANMVGLTGGHLITCVPWQWGEVAAEQIPFGGNCDLFLGHLRIGGALLTAKMAYETRAGDFGMSRAVLEQIPAKHVALGDFHKRQDLTGGRGGYVGALRQLNFGDEGNPQGFEILDTDTWTVEWVELGQCPYHRTVEINPGEEKPRQGLNERLRVRYLSAPDPDEVRELEAEGVVVQHVTEREERVARAEIPPGVMQDKRELIRLWAANQNPQVDGERLERMVEVYGEVQ